MSRKYSRGLVPFLFGLLSLLCIGAQAEAQSTLARIAERGTLILGTSGNMPSMSQADGTGKVSGFDIDLARVMANMMWLGGSSPNITT